MEQSVQNPSRKKVWILIGIVIAAGVVLAVIFNRPAQAVFGEDIRLSAVALKGASLRAVVSVPYLSTITEASRISIDVDVNGNGVFESEERVINSFPAAPQAAWNYQFAFPVTNLDGEKQVRVLLHVGDKKHEKIKTVTVEKVEVDGFMGTEKPTNPEESMKGTVFAKGEGSAAGPIGTPDFSQRPAECAPTVAANGLFSLAQRKGAADKLPKNPQEMIDSLKSDMKWTPANGVLPPDFVDGKNRWAVTHGLPIKTQMIGDRDGRGTLDEVREALAKGAAVEMRIRFADANLKVIGGHIISVVGVKEVDGKTFIDVNDPASPQGTETYEVSANEVKNYPYHDGDTVIGIGFSQVWEGAPMGGNLDGMNEAEMRGIREFAGETKMIKVISYNNKKIPLSEVHVGKGDHCDSKEQSYPHYHANGGGRVTATDGTKITDPEGCGFGKVKDVPVEDFQIP